MNLNKLLTYVLIPLVILFIIGMTCSIILSKMGGKYITYYQEQCPNGSVVYWECNDILSNSCSNLKTGAWCTLQNGSEYQVADLHTFS